MPGALRAQRAESSGLADPTAWRSWLQCAGLTLSCPDRTRRNRPEHMRCRLLQVHNRVHSYCRAIPSLISMPHPGYHAELSPVRADRSIGSRKPCVTSVSHGSADVPPSRSMARTRLLKLHDRVEARVPPITNSPTPGQNVMTRCGVRRPSVVLSSHQHIADVDHVRSVRKRRQSIHRRSASTLGKIADDQQSCTAAILHVSAAEFWRSIVDAPVPRCARPPPAPAPPPQPDEADVIGNH